MERTMVEKVARAHMTDGPDRPLRPGDVVTLRPRHVLTHDNSSAVLKKFRALGADRVADPSQPVFALDHDIQNTSPENLAKYDAIESFAREQGIDFHPAGRGIGHQLMLENGYVLPGALVVASDSHANMYGAVGALGTPVVRTDAAAIWATGEFWWKVPPTVQVVLEGEFRPGVSGKDLILTLCGLYDRGEVLNAAVEFAGPGVAALDMAARMTVANMTTEWGALVGWFPVDRVTVAWLEQRRTALEAAGVDRITAPMLEAWREAPPAPDPEARYAARIEVDLSKVSPQVAGPDRVSAIHPVEELEIEGVPVDKAYLLSCVNSRVEDLEEAASVLRGRRVAEGVELWVAAASREVQAEAERNGTWSELQEAGARTLPPGCGPCIGLGSGLLEPGEVGISATNRNFRGRMGSPDARVYLASPAVVAASAAAGYVTAPVFPMPAAGRNGEPTLPEYHFEPMPLEDDGVRDASVVDGFPDRVEGRLVFVPKDSLDTDGIYGKEHTYRDLTPEEMGEVVMLNCDPSFHQRVREGDILVSGRSFGTGSSREQAATALQARGLAMVIAASFSQTFLRNAFNNGFLCIECPSLVGRLREELTLELSTGCTTLIPGDTLKVDLSAGTVEWRAERFGFPPPSTIAQRLVAAGGIAGLLQRDAATI